jgi:hypothetical protein
VTTVVDLRVEGAPAAGGGDVAAARQHDLGRSFDVRHYHLTAGVPVQRGHALALGAKRLLANARPFVRQHRAVQARVPHQPEQRTLGGIAAALRLQLGVVAQRDGTQ